MRATRDVLLSIQALLGYDNPIECEPGYEQKKDTAFANYVRFRTLSHFINQAIFTNSVLESDMFRYRARDHFMERRKRYSRILALCEEHAPEGTRLDSRPYNGDNPVAQYGKIAELWGRVRTVEGAAAVAEAKEVEGWTKPNPPKVVSGETKGKEPAAKAAPKKEATSGDKGKEPAAKAAPKKKKAAPKKKAAKKAAPKKKTAKKAAPKKKAAAPKKKAAAPKAKKKAKK